MYDAFYTRKDKPGAQSLVPPRASILDITRHIIDRSRGFTFDYKKTDHKFLESIDQIIVMNGRNLYGVYTWEKTKHQMWSDPKTHKPGYMKLDKQPVLALPNLNGGHHLVINPRAATIEKNILKPAAVYTFKKNLDDYLNNVPSRVNGEFTSAAATSSAPGNLELNVVVPAAAPEEALNLPWVAKVNAGLNQYEIRTSDGSRTFQSYKHRIVYQDPTGKTYLDRIHWCFSSTTSKYRCLFLNEDRKTTQAKIDNGEYALVNLNPGRAAATR